MLDGLDTLSGGILGASVDAASVSSGSTLYIFRKLDRFLLVCGPSHVRMSDLTSVT